MTLLQLSRAWALVALVMIANGIFREAVLKPQIGPVVSETASAILGIALILLMTRVLLRPLNGRATAQLAIASVTLVLLTVGFEFLFGHYVDGKSWSDLAANYAIWRGRSWPVVLLVVALTPFMWGRSWGRPAVRRPTPTA